LKKICSFIFIYFCNIFQN